MDALKCPHCGHLIEEMTGFRELHAMMRHCIHIHGMSEHTNWLKLRIEWEEKGARVELPEGS